MSAQPLHGPQFGSYRADEVTWLLQDLSGVDLEQPTEDREEANQSGRKHYAETLPIEFQPSPEYQQLFHQALEESAERLAVAVGAVTELILAERGKSVVLASLARAGTPVGILIKRWAQQIAGMDWPHYAVSIVRDRGIDEAALVYLAERYDPASVVFVDGWTGKGAIARELTAALDDYGTRSGDYFNAQLAVLADPGSCTDLYGTREDFLIPSACLNSTVSGLVSRTVLNDELIKPGEFHGTKFYRELAPADVSNVFLDAVSAKFKDVHEDAVATAKAVATGNRTPTWQGWAEVQGLCEQYGITNINFVKPGVGETTRVLLRRVPWKILINPDAEQNLRHVRLLADERNVPVEAVEGLSYSCVGIIKPGEK